MTAVVAAAKYASVREFETSHIPVFVDIHPRIRLAQRVDQVSTFEHHQRTIEQSHRCQRDPHRVEIMGSTPHVDVIAMRRSRLPGSHQPHPHVIEWTWRSIQESLEEL